MSHQLEEDHDEEGMMIEEEEIEEWANVKTLSFEPNLDASKKNVSFFHGTHHPTYHSCSNADLY